MIVELYLLRSSLITNKELVMDWRVYEIDDLVTCFAWLDGNLESLETELRSVHDNMLTQEYDWFDPSEVTVEWFAEDFQYVRIILDDSANILAHIKDDLNHAVYSQYQLVWQTMMSRYNACKKHYAQDVTLRINFRR